MATTSRSADLTSGPMLQKIILFSVPLAASSILQLLFNAADVVVVGRFAGSTALAAVGSNGALINLLVNLFVGLSLGANVVAARCFGARDEKGVQDTVHTAVALGLVSGVLLAVVGFCAARGLLELMSCPEDVIGLSTLYLRIYFIGMPMTMLYNFSSALLRAVGDTKRPLYCLAAAGAINVVLNLVFVIGFSMSVAGDRDARPGGGRTAAGPAAAGLPRRDAEADFAHRSARRAAEHGVQSFQRGHPVLHQLLWFHGGGGQLCLLQSGGLCVHRHECFCAGRCHLYQPEHRRAQVPQP